MQILLIILVIYILLEIPTCFGMGLIFKKINLDFKKGIIPFYNKIILINKYKLPQYHLILIFLPLIGIYSNYVIYDKLCKTYNKDSSYVLQLTLFPFVFNIFLGIELQQQKEKEQINNYFEDQKNIYDIDLPDEEEKKDEYIWYPKQKIKNDTVYKASRNNLNAKVNLNMKKTNEIIDNKKQLQNKKNYTKICPKCGTKIPSDIEVCYVCGTKL